MSVSDNIVPHTFNWDKFANTYQSEEDGFISKELDDEYKGLGAFKLGWLATAWQMPE